MKKRLTAVLLVALVMLAGCGGYDNTSMDITKIDVDSYIETLGEYKGLTIETEPKMTITDNTVDDYINYVLSASGQTSTTEVDRAAKEGDIVNIDYEGIKDGGRHRYRIRFDTRFRTVYSGLRGWTYRI